MKQAEMKRNYEAAVLQLVAELTDGMVKMAEALKSAQRSLEALHALVKAGPVK